MRTSHSQQFVTIHTFTTFHYVALVSLPLH